MVDDDGKPSTEGAQERALGVAVLEVSEPDRSVPIAFVDEIGAAGHYGGIVHVSLHQLIWGSSPGGKLASELRPVVSLRMNLIAARALRDVLSNALLLAAPTPDDGQKH